MRVLVSIDDTDDLESPGTGALLAELASLVEASGWAACSYITRHQLFVHPDIPFTSHNAAMCLEADVLSGQLDALVGFAAAFLERRSAPGSDPGLCVAVRERLFSGEPLVEFGRLAKAAVLTKAEACELAGRAGVHLSEHGGTGLGVIGALAAAGLRLSGDDGRLRGKLALPAGVSVLSVRELLQLAPVDAVRDLRGRHLPGDARVRCEGKVKTVMRGGQSVLLVVRDERASVAWRTCAKEELKSY